MKWSTRPMLEHAGYTQVGTCTQVDQHIGCVGVGIQAYGLTYGGRLVKAPIIFIKVIFIKNHIKSTYGYN